MFEFVRTHNKLFQLILLILILPSFVLVGVQSYSSFMGEANAGVANVDGHKITQAEWDAALRQQVERLRAQSPNTDPKLYDTPEFKRESLDALVRERVMQVASVKQNLLVSDERLANVFRNDPQFAFLRNPDGSVNKNLLTAQGMSSEMFARRLRQDLSLRQVLGGVADSALPTAVNATLAFDALLQRREVQFQRFDVKDFASQVNPSEAELQAFYKDPAHSARFQLPESAEIEYVVLDLDALLPEIKVAEEDLRKYYTENESRFAVAEERRASHILIKADKDASKEQRGKARAKAEELLAQLRKTPTAFAELARKNSQDEGSAANGGDLDFFGRGAMVKPFEDATFALKSGEISNVVESDFGFHIIQLTGVRGGDHKSFESVRAQIEQDVRRQLAQKRYAELAEQFSNTAYEQSDSLKPAADLAKLKIQTATVQRKPGLDAVGPLASAKLLDALFGDESLRNKRNTEAVETGANQLVSARVIKHQPARLPELSAVLPQVRAELVNKLAGELAVKKGKERLTELKGSGAVDGLSAPVLVSRAAAGGLPRPVLQAVLSADVAKLPAYVGAETGDGGYAVLRIGKLMPRDPGVIDEKRAAQQYAQAWTAAETQAYYSALKARYKTTVKPVAASAAP